MIRKFPYPFRNMLAILSDADCNDKEKFEGTHKFMNTFTDCGNMGFGVGLDIGDTFFMGLLGKTYKGKPHAKEWYYWCTKTGMEIAAGHIRKYIKVGWIDIPHTFFHYIDKNAFSRQQALDVVREWKRIDYKPIAWVDHSDCPWDIMFFYERKLATEAKSGDSLIFFDSRYANTGNYVIFPSTGEKVTVKQIDASVRPYIITLDRSLKNAYPKGEYFIVRPDMRHCGADPSSEFYCADLAIQAGIKAFWAPIPQDTEIKTLGGSLGFDTCLIEKKLPDNRNVWGLLRYLKIGQTSNNMLGKCINRVLFGDEFSDGKPAAKDTYIVITTHLGYGFSDSLQDGKGYKYEYNIYELNGGKWFNDETIKAFRSLRMKQENGEILVTRTSRLIKYNLAHDMLTKYANTTDGFTIVKSPEGEKVIIHKIHDDCFGEFVPNVEDLRGITFYCKNPQTTQIWIGDTRVDTSEIQVNDKDHTGLKSVGIRWYEQDTTDYTEK